VKFEYTLRNIDMETYSQDVYDKIVDIIKSKNPQDKFEITPKSHLTNDIGLDSMDFTEVIIDIEKTYPISISELEAGKIKDVEGLAILITKLINKKL